MIKYLFIIALLILSSCSPVKRFSRLIDKYPYLLTSDTVTIHDTVNVIVPQVVHDTSFIDNSLYDTVYIDKERLKIKLWRVMDTVYVEGECESDTIEVIRQIEVPVKYYETGKWYHDIPWWVYLMALSVIAYYLYKRLRKVLFPEN
jgi:hypothetical protein